MIKKLIKLIVGDDIEIRERLFRIILALGCVASITALIINILMGLSMTIVFPLIILAVVTQIALLVTIKYHRLNVSAWIMGLVALGVLFPQIFTLGGGLESGAPIWLVLGLVYIFLLFSGKSLIVALIYSIGTYAALYLTVYLHPDLIVPMEKTSDMYIDSFIALLLVGSSVGILIKFQTKVFMREKEKSDKQRDELERISQSKSAFFANMSHEIRTPINTIIGLNEMILREQGISDEIAENAINIQNASKMLLSLINDILDLSKLESGKMEIVPVQYETGAMFSELVNIIWIRAHEKNLEFRIDVSPEIPSMLYGDEVRMKQILVNILTNAVKYTETGSVTLSAKGERIGDNLFRLNISVQDTGIGIKKENLDDLFASFRRVDQERNRKIEGTGLGLSISKQLVDMMGGTIAVDSIYKKGTNFTVTIDQQIVNAKPVGSLNFMLKQNLANRSIYQQSFEAPDAHILVVDDNEMNRLVATKLLRATKVHIDTAASGKECLELTKQHYYQVIFMDQVMPEMDGEETLACIRTQENGFCQKTPVIALTANVMSGAEKIYSEKGFDGYLAKPINGSLFEATLLKYLPSELIEYSLKNGVSEEDDETVQLVFGKQKKKITITTDCVCDIPEEWMEHFDIKCMYYYVFTDRGRFCDLKELSSDNLLNYLKDNGSKVRSECAPVEEYENFFANVLGGSEEIIHISMASQSSDGYGVASAASKGFDHVSVVDSGHLSSGMGLIVLYAAQMAQDGASTEEIQTMIGQLKDRVSTSFIVPNTTQMYRSGKVGKQVNLLCDSFDLHLILHLAQNKIKVQRIVTGRTSQAYRKYIHRALANSKKIDKRILFITYSGCTVKQLEEIKKEVEKYVQFEQIRFQKASATISCNCGIGTFGLLFMKQK